MQLWRAGRSVPMKEWARELIDSMRGICEILDRGDATEPYATALATQAAKIEDVTLTPSARLMAELKSTHESFFELALRMSAMHKAYFLDLYTPNPGRLAELGAEATDSLERQRAMEAGQTESFEDYVTRYFAD